MAENQIAPSTVSVESLAGVPEGTVLPSGETVVGSYDENDKLVGCINFQ